MIMQNFKKKLRDWISAPEPLDTEKVQKELNELPVKVADEFEAFLSHLREDQEEH